MFKREKKRDICSLNVPQQDVYRCSLNTLWLEQCHKSPMTGNGKHTTLKNGDDWGMVIMILF